MHAFDNANNFVVNNLIQTEYRTSDGNGFKLLQDHVVKGAAHNSGERFDAPKCHPETRTAVLSSIKSWLDSKDTERIMWLHGPAGAGKSAIAQTTAEDCEAEGTLAASFFFYRLAGRNKKDGLIATIAYQICVSIPAVKEQVIKNIERNPQIFTANIKTQLHWLVVEPLRWLEVQPLHYDTSIGAIPRIIIVDGLDECEIRKDRVEIIESVASSLCSVTRVLLVSRPELDIRVAFTKDNISPLCTTMVLDDSFAPDKDIELYLKSHFQTIRREHTLGQLLPKSWPSDDSIKKLVTKSSGQFVYASTVIHFITDAEHDPRERLDMILQIRPAENDDKPYAQLDALYSAVLSMCQDYVKAITIFEAIMFIEDKTILQSVECLEILLLLKDKIMLLLANLHSIVDVNNIAKYGIRFYHASLFDYLVDSSRSHAFYIDPRDGHVHLSIKCLHILLNLPSEAHIRRGYSFLRTVFKFCFNECFTHYKYSGWDDRVFGYMDKMGVFKPDLELKLPTSLITSGNTYTSMLSRLIQCVGSRSVPAANARVIGIIDAEFLIPLEQYPRKDIIYILFIEVTTARSRNSGASSIAYTLHRKFTKTYMPGYMNIMRGEIFTNTEVQEWFIDLMNHIGYIRKIPNDVHFKAICSILELLMKGSAANTLVAGYLIRRMFDELPLSKKISYELSKKWSILNDDSENYIVGVDATIESYIQTYRKRVKDSRRGVLSANSPKMGGVKGSFFAWTRNIFRTDELESPI